MSEAQPPHSCPAHSAVIERLTGHDREIRDLRKDEKELRDAMFDIRDRLINRPGWTVTTIISLLVTLLSVLATIHFAR